MLNFISFGRTSFKDGSVVTITLFIYMCNFPQVRVSVSGHRIFSNIYNFL